MKNENEKMLEEPSTNNIGTVKIEITPEIKKEKTKSPKKETIKKEQKPRKKASVFKKMGKVIKSFFK